MCNICLLDCFLTQYQHICVTAIWDLPNTLKKSVCVSFSYTDEVDELWQIINNNN